MYTLSVISPCHANCIALVRSDYKLCCSRGMLGWIVLILVAWIFIYWTATYLALSKLNFLKR